MKKRTPAAMLLVLFAMLFMLAWENASAETPEDAFRRIFPDFRFEEIKTTDMTGIYEVRKGADIIYFLPEYGYLFFGEIISREGKNLTQQRKDELVAETAKKLPLDKAVTFGSGRHIVIEFTDPDCPYCRKASELLKSRTDITRHVFFLPLPMHPDAGNKSKYVLCAEDRAKAYEEAMSGKLDDRKYQTCAKSAVSDILDVHIETARKVGVSGTPFFIINSKTFVRGADIQALEAALSRK